MHDNRTCEHHFHDEDPAYLDNTGQSSAEGDVEAGAETTSESLKGEKNAPQVQQTSRQPRLGFRMIVQNFTPSYVPLLGAQYRSMTDRDGATQAGSSSS